jgi:MFS family permease
LIGNLILGIGGASESWGLILFGRLIGGIGIMTCTVTVTVLVTKWFINSNLNLAYALLAVSWGPTTLLSSIITPKLYGTVKDPHLGTAFFAAFWLNLISIIFLIPVVVIDKMADNELKDIEEEKLDDIKQILVKDSNEVTVDIIEKKTCLKWSDLKGLGDIYWFNNFSSGA